MKSIQERLDAAKEQLIILSINNTLDLLVKNASCKHDECDFNIANACKGNEKNSCPGGSACIGLCQHAIEYDESGKQIL